MLRRMCFTIVLFFSILYISYPALSTEINTLNYDIYIGDINSDGSKDFFFKAKTYPLVLHSDIAIPLIIARGASFVIYRAGTNYKLPPVVFNSYSAADIAVKLANGTLVKAVAGTNYTALEFI